MTRYAAVLLPLLLLACSPPRTQFSATASDSSYILADERDAEAVADAYRERVRLGLGSPFRVIETAAYDRRLTPEFREELLADLFERVLDGHTYEIGPTLPIAHYRVIEHALRSTYDPRIAELAVNLTYEVAIQEKTVDVATQYAAASTVALMRDRALAQYDAQHVREVARTHNQPAHALVPAMRAQRALLLEQPLMPALSAEAQEAASRLALMLIGGVRQAARSPQPFVRTKDASELDHDVAERILALQTTAERLPQSALIIAMRSAQLPYTARDEEAFVAELALIGTDATLAAQRAAIALRPFAQEVVHAHVHAHAVAPDARTFLADFGITLRFRDDVPEAWRAHYAHTLYDALTDLRVAAPGITLTGLTIEVGEVAEPSRHLAYHDPAGRIIRWAPSTGAGTLAHEIAHDLDWQAARRSGRSGYASDLSRDVAGMILGAGQESGDERATEVFARYFDWVVAASLGQEGRLNGQLSAVQHDWLPGHGGARPPLPNSRSGRGLAAYAAKAGRMSDGAQERMETAITAPELPLAVHAVREVRAGVAAEAGPRRSVFESASQAATTTYVELLAHSAGVVPIIDSGAGQAEGGDAGARKGPQLLWTY